MGNMNVRDVPISLKGKIKEYQAKYFQKKGKSINQDDTSKMALDIGIDILLADIEKEKGNNES